MSESTFDREMKNQSFKKKFDQSYKRLVLSEIINAMMQNDSKSVRKLAKEAGLSPTIIQKLKSGKQSDIKFSNFLNVIHACGYDLILTKDDEQIVL